MKNKSGFKTDFTAKSVNKGSEPFSNSWSNSRPLASTKGLTGAPGGTLSPKQLAGVGNGKK